ncbi:MAG TPA: GTP 3',8-cyclase MoaA [Bacillota bacterium]|nr:GTP 3',8-cyclase MoaA [Bacillota bacterium]
MALIDSYGRKHDYLRISVTDRCNLRCIYCMGEAGIKLIPHQEILRYEEILQVVEAGAAAGIRKIRLTGGEPLVRKDLATLVEKIAGVKGIEDLAMTTNGVLLSREAHRLKQAGLKRVNISLDSLDRERYKRITRIGELKHVLEGIEAALREGLAPVKINMVLMKGLNHDEVPAFLKLTATRPLHVRFIEYMPIGDHDREYRRHYLPLEYVRETAARAGMPLIPVPSPGGAGPAETFAIPGAQGTVGLIRPISQHFCHSCNRLRLTAEGKLKACLYWQDEHPVRPALGDPAKLQALYQKVLDLKAREHHMSPGRKSGPVNPGAMRTMSKTGG